MITVIAHRPWSLKDRDIDLRNRLREWGIWARRDPCRPDDSCENRIYRDYIPDQDYDEGHGEVTEATQRRIYATETRGELEPIDELAAENLDGWIRQLSQGHRAILNRRYVLLVWLTPYERELVTGAVHALRFLMAGNRDTLEAMERSMRNTR